MKPIRGWLQFGPPGFKKHGLTTRNSTPADVKRSRGSVIQPYINRLPAELLAHIFFHCLPNPFTNPNHPFAIPKLGHAPLLLCQICGYWREVALATHTLWGSIAINTGTIRRQLVALWLERSHPSTISFHIWSSPSGKAFVKIFAMLLANIDRWEDVHLTLDERLCKMFLAIPRERLSLSAVKGLTFDARNCTQEQHTQLLSLTRLFPTLRRLAFHALLDPYSDNTPLAIDDVPCSQLTHLRLDGGLSLFQCSKILSNCRQAVDCELSRIFGSDEPVIQDNILLPHLKTLKLESVPNTCDLGQLLGLLTCPKIRTLSIDQGKWRLPTSDLHPFKQFMNRSEYGLQELRLTSLNVAETDMIECLQTPALRSIRTLSLSTQPVTDKTLDFLRRGGEDHDTFPCLEKLSLEFCYTSDGAFADMVVSRRAADMLDGATLQSVHVTFRLPLTIEQLASQPRGEMDDNVRRAHKEDIARMQELQQEGLRASWSTNVWR